MTKTSFKITRLYADSQGHSHFEDTLLPLNPVGSIGEISAREDVKSWCVRTMPGDYDMDYHCTDKRQYVVVLSGAVEMEVSSGDKRLFEAGDIVLVEDKTGQGHKSRSVNGQPRTSLFIALE